MWEVFSANPYLNHVSDFRFVMNGISDNVPATPENFRMLSEISEDVPSPKLFKFLT